VCTRRLGARRSVGGLLQQPPVRLVVLPLVQLVRDIITLISIMILPIPTRCHQSIYNNCKNDWRNKYNKYVFKNIILIFIAHPFNRNICIYKC
jgi:hypothetical protein